LVVLFGLCAAILAIIVVLNLALAERTIGGPAVLRMASDWQERTKGITYAPPITDTRPFKSLRLADQLADVNAVVLGSSTMMGITKSMFPPHLRAYNFALTANPTASISGEADFLIAHHGNTLRWMLVSLDWPIGMIYHAGGVRAVNLTRAAALAPSATPAVPLHKRLEDALALPQIRVLGRALKSVARSARPLDAFRHTFLEKAGEAYACADGVLARDFDAANPGICLGFRYDGSWTFAGERRLSDGRATILARAAAARSSKFSRFLCETGGDPNPAYLERLGEVARRFAATGGQVVFILPPLIPGMEAEMLKVEENRTCLERTKTSLGEWANRYSVAIIDAAASEYFGCQPQEFLDEHHAFPECHTRVLNAYWKDTAAGLIKPGLYRPDRRPTGAARQ
jgi:hypothetical protein